MKQKIKKLWVDALRSGEYKQGKSVLCSEDKYCCLGVLCELAYNDNIINKEKGVHASYPNEVCYYDNESHLLPASVMKWAGLHDRAVSIRGNNMTTTGSLSGYNDNDWTFDALADLIEEKL